MHEVLRPAFLDRSSRGSMEVASRLSGRRRSLVLLRMYMLKLILPKRDRSYLKLSTSSHLPNPLNPTWRSKHPDFRGTSSSRLLDHLQPRSDFDSRWPSNTILMRVPCFLGGFIGNLDHKKGKRVPLGCQGFSDWTRLLFILRIILSPLQTPFAPFPQDPWKDKAAQKSLRKTP